MPTDNPTNPIRDLNPKDANLLTHHPPTKQITNIIHMPSMNKTKSYWA